MGPVVLPEEHDGGRGAFESVAVLTELWASQVVLVVKNLPANAGDVRGFYPLVRKIPWRRAWQPTPVFLPGESNEQWSLGNYSP